MADSLGNDRNRPLFRHLGPQALVALLVTTSLAFPPTPAAGTTQEPGADAPSGYMAALSSLEEGDTATAIDRLRQVVGDEPDYGPAFFRLGVLLTEIGTGPETDTRVRREATLMLDRAYQLMGDDPELLVQYGLLLRRRDARNDAKRVLNRAWRIAEEKGRDMSPEGRVRLHYTLGRYYEEYNLDWQGLVAIPSTAEEVSCHGIRWVGDGVIDNSLIRLNAVTMCPEAWAEHTDHAVPIEHLNDDDRERMLGHFRRALEIDPGHTGAATAVLGYLADDGDWDPYDSLAARFVADSPEDPRAHLFVGLGLHARGRYAEAEQAFGRAIDRFRPEERRVFDNVAELLPLDQRDAYVHGDSATRATIERIVFTAKDPLYLSDPAERRLEHYARLAWAELKFAEPRAGRRGWESDRGRIWVRYGRPWRSLVCCFWGVGGDEHKQGRVIYWSYGRRGPVFAFSKVRTNRAAYFTEVSGTLASRLEEAHPEAYAFPTITTVLGVPHQVARFRGSGAGLTRVEIYAAPPLDSLAAPPGTELETGIFTFSSDYTPVWQRKTLAAVTERGVGLTYRLQLPPGSYRYSLEARRTGPESEPRPVARARAELEAEAFPASRLSVSDLLLAVDTVRPRAAAPSGRGDLVVVPLRGTTVRAGEPLHLYFEVYALTSDADGIGSYSAELAVEDSTRRNVVSRLFRAGRELFGFGGEEQAEIRWEAQVRVIDDLAVEYLSVAAPDLEPGEYTIRVRLTDLATGQTAETARAIRVRGPPGEND